MSEDDQDDIDEHVKIFGLTDKRMQEIGQILRTPKSREILHILSTQELNAKEIGKIIDNDDNPRLPNLHHHLNKMMNVGLITSRKKLQRKNGHVLNYYKAASYIVIVPQDQFEKATKSKTLKNAFKNVFKIAAIGVPALIVYNTQNIFWVSVDLKEVEIEASFFLPSLVIISGLIIERIYHHKNYIQSLLKNWL